MAWWQLPRPRPRGPGARGRVETLGENNAQKGEGCQPSSSWAFARSPPQTQCSARTHQSRDTSYSSPLYIHHPSTSIRYSTSHSEATSTAFHTLPITNNLHYVAPPRLHAPPAAMSVVGAAPPGAGTAGAAVSASNLPPSTSTPSRPPSFSAPRPFPSPTTPGSRASRRSHRPAPPTVASAPPPPAISDIARPAYL